MKFYSSMANFASLAVKMQKLDTAIAGRSWVAAMKAAEYGLKHNEGLDEELGCFAVLACLSYEKIMRTGSADEFLLALAEKHSNLECLSLAKIRLLLNRGQVKEAEGVARQLSKSDTYEIFCRSENFIEALFGAAER